MTDNTEDYILSVSSPEDPLLAELYRQTHLRMMNPRMCAGHIQGRLLSFVSRMLKPQTILEIGTFTGYGTICLAEGLSSEGQLHTLEKEEELLDFASAYFEKSGILDRVAIHLGDALQLIPALPFSFDLVYIDGEKREYPDYYRACMQKLAPGGYILADNVLWNNKVLKAPDRSDKATLAVREFNEMVNNDPGVENVILPIRDGIMLIRKKNA